MIPCNYYDRPLPKLFQLHSKGCTCLKWHTKLLQHAIYTAGEDYQPLTTTITFPPGTISGPASRQCSAVTIIDDNIFEKKEMFSLTITSISSLINVITDIGTLTVLIQENDGEQIRM
jgi:hypothetical protein